MSIVQYVNQPQLWTSRPSALHQWWKPIKMHEDELSFDLDSIIEVISEHSRRHVEAAKPAEDVVEPALPLMEVLIETVDVSIESSNDEPNTATEESEVALSQGIFALSIVYTVEIKKKH